MRIIERVRALSLPTDEVVVIGSGVLDALDLREAGDVDLVVSLNRFERLKNDNAWHVGEKNGEPIAVMTDVEAFLSWGSNGVPNFNELYDAGVTIQGIRFAHPRFVVEWKRQRASEKDLHDIALLEEYMRHYDIGN